ncbi:FMN-binding negative transcriptional regulator [Bacillus salitolerans]|uniref:FMN-binding negative transcriptional regulator n=1 Tax=Bacillus salitolerans TaxID=1437434 RepID=A0ABW4LTY9_9BACI
MYIPKHYEITDEDVIYDYIEKNSFAILFSQHNGEPYATHLPLQLNRDEKELYGHIARPNEQWKDAENQQVLAVFQGPHCYISPSWYETTRAVPTWNYVSIHVYGKMEIIEDEQVAFQLLSDLVDQYEAPNSSYKLNQVEPRYVEGMSRGIVAFKIKITKIDAKAKLSQNQSIQRQELIIQHLENSTQHNQKEIASLMKKNLQ